MGATSVKQNKEIRSHYKFLLNCRIIKEFLSGIAYKFTTIDKYKFAYCAAGIITKSNESKYRMVFCGSNENLEILEDRNIYIFMTFSTTNCDMPIGGPIKIDLESAKESYQLAKLHPVINKNPRIIIMTFPCNVSDDNPCFPEIVEGKMPKGYK
jgi:hypothetical protein